VGDLTLIASRQARLYDREYGWGRAMELLQGEIITAFLRDFQPGREQCWVAEREGAMLGAVLLADAGGGTAKLRLLHVEAEARGLGIGRALVEQCVLFAASAGYARIRLWTQSVLTSARRLYQATGFALIGAEEHQLLGSPLTGETWERPLP
jgi:GNAT superfamily N-acetyltransferase